MTLWGPKYIQHNSKHTNAPRFILFRWERSLSIHAVSNLCPCFRELFVFFIKQILCKEMTPQICYFLVPSICNQIPIKSFVNAVPDTSDSHSIWLLYSFILILESKVGMTDFLLNSFFVSFLFPISRKSTNSWMDQF